MSATSAFSSQALILSMALDKLAQSKLELSDAATAGSLGPITRDEYTALGTVSARNAHVVEMVRGVLKLHGSIAGWEYLARITSIVWFPKELVLDAVAGTKLFAGLRPGNARRDHDDAPTDLAIIISTSALRESITRISPKSLGGKHWMQDPMYPAVLEDWSSGSGFAPLGPCVAFGFLGLQRKTVRGRANIGDADAILYLGALVDYDLDCADGYAPSFENALGVALRCLGDPGCIQGVAIAGLLNFDIQRHNREIQRRWVARKIGWPVRRDISSDDWVTMAVSDSASLGAFGSEEAGTYAESKLGIFGALLLASQYDLIYDRVTSNLATTVMYTAAAGMTQYNMYCICSTSILDLVARRTISSEEEEEGFVPLYGDNSVLFTAAWAVLCGRYHTWERFVKYSRQISRSTRTDVRILARMAKESLVLPSTDIADAWRRANTQGAESTLIPRMTTQYTPSPAPEVAALPPAHLCSVCLGAFSDALEAYETDQIYAIAGLPPSVVKCAEVAMVAAIHRAALFASSANCCEVCACRIGCWADEACHAVMMAFMRSERDCSASEWGLRCYLVGCVPLTPVSVPSILSGFDLLCEVTEHEGAMGSRDVLDI